MSAATRIEHDFLGAVEVPASRYYGAHTARANENFPVSGIPVGGLRPFLTALAQVKIAAARANFDEGGISGEKRDAIVQACREIIDGRFAEEFTVDVFQGGAGTSTNMNVNEVVASRASELLGGSRGPDRLVHPNDDVNRSQSTNDAYATAARLSLVPAIRKLAASLKKLGDAFADKAAEFDGVDKLGRTQLRDAVRMTLGQEFRAFSVAVLAQHRIVADSEAAFHAVNIGGTAIGTGIAATDDYRARVLAYLGEETGLPLVRADDLLAASWDMSAFALLTGKIRGAALTVSKIANDLRLLSSGPQGGIGEIVLPTLQAGSSLMPGKSNPVAAEAVSQAFFFVCGLDTTVTKAAEAGQLQLNAMAPVIVYSTHFAAEILGNAVAILADKCVRGIVCDRSRCLRHLEASTAFATDLVATIGYDAATRVVREHIAKAV